MQLEFFSQHFVLACAVKAGSAKFASDTLLETAHKHRRHLVQDLRNGYFARTWHGIIRYGQEWPCLKHTWWNTESTGVRNTCVYVNVCTCFLLSTLLFASIPTPFSKKHQTKRPVRFCVCFFLFCLFFVPSFVFSCLVEFCWFFRVPRSRSQGNSESPLSWPSFS